MKNKEVKEDKAESRGQQNKMSGRSWRADYRKDDAAKQPRESRAAWTSVKWSWRHTKIRGY